MLLRRNQSFERANVASLRMSALGQKRTSEHVQAMSAFLPKADIAQALIDRSLFTRFDTAIRTVRVLSAIVGPRLTELPAKGGI